ncbi:interleukin-12 subunit alpha-like [Gadus macrocephalus]|uniref:interleukin-12 subunit alpha-like n=1 Tax=Gadus macrocephalus TaxID=80720 RepID=UPI0028CB19EA|nr:interleukin-12 subunit alpha-like [Gadus macrocephalus]
MAKLTSYIVSWVLLLTACLRLSAGVPVPCCRMPANTSLCTSHSLELLQHIRTLLADEVLFSSIWCPEREVEVTTSTDTASVCAPSQEQDSRCLTPTNIPTPFNANICLGNIATDLDHYAKVLQSYLDINHQWNPTKEEAMLKPMIREIKGLRTHCSLDNITVDTFREVHFPLTWEEKSFDDRKRLCEVMHGFYIRAITINRALGYISSGDHCRQDNDSRKTTSQPN